MTNTGTKTVERKKMTTKTDKHDQNQTWKQIKCTKLIKKIVKALKKRQKTMYD